MKFKNRLKGNVTQTLISSLLEDAGYRIVPLGVEEVVREVQCLSQEEYRKLSLCDAMRSLPDFFIGSKELDASWLLEIKFRKQWNENTRRELESTLFEQAKLWQPLRLIIFLGTDFHGNGNPAGYIKAGDLVIEDGVLGLEVKEFRFDSGKWEQTDEQIRTFVPWSSVTWQHLRRIQDVFPLLTGKFGESTIIKTASLLKGLGDLDLFD